MNAAPGSTPRGTSNEDQAARWVRRMFDSVAHRYDLLNHLLSFNADRYWRARAAARVSHLLAPPEARVLDLCCGTGDLLFALASRRGALVYGADFSRPMLAEAARKSRRRGARAALFEADALRLPLPGASLDLLTIAFGFRNLANYRRGLAELRRVLKPGGVLAILEFTQPPNRVFAALYDFYSRRILPRIGAWISGSPGAYAYLPESVGKFPTAPALAEEMRQAGFADVRYEYLTFGVAALHLGR
jgi:demethylmenaquinone methyltransferase/2-methoxy-6-polyprenyl-1,4-benzoquinol methylase